ncbi:DUF1841 family protein [Thauera linaloolentis]|uniref:DUF1841 family protein n=1 Tax=Thauera linaloolentis (strain DSM 12138 / JCM 21573 / CCUG 41526 / CIP 105981 / IAM 15112 / NBRC 102519 / 47Lol) TaxID=1123367 RepID=N6XZ19_THAL4|nr:DUF1841 family protein [Thauera linaloolentis]ENO87081.1 hypothetical protein C666_11710 [Thauera linaloolentis 47Lol = DSM 12138]MCM8565520.1 DUF1841 family protein [Thauera linaloolentis]
MFNPSRDQVRSFFIEAWRKHRAREVLTPMETIAADLIGHHPEYHPIVEDPDAIGRDFTPEDGGINPFLHLSLHLAIEEQLSIDQPPGIRAAFEAACAHRGNRHDAMHDALECLGEALFDAQRSGTQPDGLAYVASLKKKAGIG